MPRNSRSENDEPGTSLALPADIMNDLMAQNAGMVESSFEKFPQVKLLRDSPKFEFNDDDSVVAKFYGVILNAHSRNVLWDKPFGSAPASSSSDAEGPGCNSVDGRYGTPRIGFRHAALGGEPATGLERIECRSCPYNQWKSKELIGGSGNGKAVSNQRMVYILPMTEAGELTRETPVSLTLSSMSSKPLDEYIRSALNRNNMPVQAILTEFAGVRVTKGALAWNQVTFKMARALTQDEFLAVIQRRGTYLGQMTPTSQPPEAVMEDAQVLNNDDDDMPF